MHICSTEKVRHVKFYRKRKTQSLEFFLFRFKSYFILEISCDILLWFCTVNRVNILYPNILSFIVNRNPR